MSSKRMLGVVGALLAVAFGLRPAHEPVGAW
jgi:hypothetical protein